MTATRKVAKLQPDVSSNKCSNSPCNSNFSFSFTHRFWDFIDFCLDIFPPNLHSMGRGELWDQSVSSQRELQHWRARNTQPPQNQGKSLGRCWWWVNLYVVFRVRGVMGWTIGGSPFLSKMFLVVVKQGLGDHRIYPWSMAVILLVFWFSEVWALQKTVGFGFPKKKPGEPWRSWWSIVYWLTPRWFEGTGVALGMVRHRPHLSNLILMPSGLIWGIWFVPKMTNQFTQCAD